jgi:uncharacterized protein (DUF2141 family)
MKKQILTVLILSSIVSLTAVELSGTIEGVRSEGKVYIFVAEEGDKPLTGRYSLVLEPVNDILEYRFSYIEPGLYSVRIYQDVNGNGKLDFGIFGPSEPWALSWVEKKKAIPQFEDIAIEITSDTKLSFILE